MTCNSRKAIVKDLLTIVNWSLTKEIKKENYFEKFCSSLTDLFYFVTKEAKKTKGKISVSALFLKKISDQCLFGLIVFALPSLENLCALFTVMKFSPFNTAHHLELIE